MIGTMIHTLLLISLFAASGRARAVSESKFEELFDSQIMSEFWARGTSEYLTAPDGLRLHYRKHVQPGQDKALIILPGRTESSWKFAEVVHDLQDLNFAIFILDHRGQGASGREVTGSDVQFVSDFKDYRDDLALLVKNVIEPYKFKQTMALAHSMGANILALYMADKQEAISKAVVTSPMLDINPAPFPYGWMPHLLATIACWLGKDKSYLFNAGPYDSNVAFRGTNSELRFKHFRRLRNERKAEQVGGASYRFAQKALEATDAMRTNAEKLLTPLLLLQAGSDDVVLTGGQDYVCQYARQCRKLVLPGAMHELHVEKDSIRDVWMAEVRSFLSTP